MALVAHCLPPDICFLCLSRDRKIFCLPEKINHIFGFLTDWYPQTDARVCWECRAMLERLHRFKEQAKQAVCALERARIGLQPMSFECLSTLYGTNMLFIDLLIYDDENVTDDFSVRKNKIYKVEVEFEDKNPKIKTEIEEELDVSENTIHENATDHMAEDDNDIGTECFQTIGWTEDNTEHAIQHIKEINLPLANLKIDAPSSSAEGEIASKNVDNCSAIKKTKGVVKTTVKRKKPTIRRIRRNLTTAEKLIEQERRAEEQKYELYQQGKSFECDHCGKKYDTRRKILVHMKVHFKTVMCDQCAYKCRNHSGLKKHMLAHLDPSHRPHECEVCHKRFIDKYKLLVHTRSHTGESKNSVVRRHKKRNYKVKKNNENITYECNVCKQIFVRIKLFYKHYYSAHKKVIPCAECDQTFKWKWQLTYHVSIVHRGERPYQCNICGAGSLTKSTLQVHMSSHSNEKPFKCDECLATFKYKCGLYTHKLIHKGDKPHRCEICEARFTLKSNLAGHMKVHTKEKPFECNICSKKFPWKRNLKNHLKTHFKEQQ